MKKSLFFLLVAALAVSMGVYWWRSASADRPEFRTLPVNRGDLLLAVSATGTVEPVETIDVGARIPGMIKNFGPDPNEPGKTITHNSRVKEGDVLAQLDDAPATADLEKAVANVKLSKGELARAEARYKQAESAYHRAERLRDRNQDSRHLVNAISDTDYENAVAMHAMTKSEVEIAAGKLDLAEAMKKEADIQLQYTVIRSPVDGVVIDRRVNVGQTVVASFNAPSLFLLAKDLSHLSVRAAVNEADIGDIRVGQPVTFKVDSCRDQEFKGSVSKILLNASYSSSVVMFDVQVDVDNTDQKLLPYVTAKLQFEVARRTDVLLVSNQALRWQPTLSQVSPSARRALPQSALRPAADTFVEEGEPKVELDSPTVWGVAADGFVRPIQVQTGLSDGINTEVTGGDLKPNTQIVINAVREAQPDFVKSFISQVVNTKK
jgi:HlyD family secretion protein